MARAISYEFIFGEVASWRYELEFDDQHRLIAPAIPGQPRAWTSLEFQQCSNCPLNSANSPQCPVARNLDHIVEDSKATVSFTRATVRVVTPERTYTKECATQEGLRSLFGLIMACSGCPHLDWLRPLTRFHLPFADQDETLYRVLSLEFVESFLNASAASLPECVAKIHRRYEEVEKVNQAFVQRIRTYCLADADKNALASLDLFAQFFALHQADDFDELRNVIPGIGGKA